MTVSIAVDCMGGDHGIKTTVPASLKFSKKNQGTKVILVGDEVAIGEELKKYKVDLSRFELIGADQVVTMEDEPTQALRNKRNSSMRVAIDLVKEGKQMLL